MHLCRAVVRFWLVVLVLVAQQALAQSVAWRVSTYGSLPSVLGSFPQTTSYAADGSLYAADELYDAKGVGLRISHYQPGDGQLLWQHDVEIAAPAAGTVAVYGPRAALASIGTDVVVASTNYENGKYYGRIARYAAGDGARLWINSEAPAHDLAYVAIATNSAGDIFVAGNEVLDVYTGHVARFNSSDGSLVWSTHVDPAACGAGATSDFHLSNVAIGPNSDVIVVGSFGPTSSGAPVFCAVKFSGKDGSFGWAYTHRPAGQISLIGDSPKVAIDAQSDVVAEGCYRLPTNSDACAVVKLDSTTGMPLWARDQAMLGVAPSASIALTSVGDIVLSAHGYTTKLAIDSGDPVWSQNAPVGGAVAIESSDNVVIASSNAPGPNGSPVTYYALDGEDGTTLWSKPLPPNGIDRWNSPTLSLDNAGHFAALQVDTHGYKYRKAQVVSGDSTSGELGWQVVDPVEGPSDAILEDNPGDILGRTSALSPDGAVITAALTYAPNPAATSAYETLIVKRSARDGHLIWSTVLDIPNMDGCEASSLAVDANGDAVVAGSCYSDAYTAKIQGTDGHLLWIGSGTVGCESSNAMSIALDASNDAYVTGYCHTESATEQLTVKYDGRTGAVIWPAITPATPSGSSNFLVTVDSSGGVVVSGPVDASSAGTPTAEGISVSRLTPSNGTSIWTKTIDPLSGDSLDLRVLATAPGSGDIVFSGIERVVSGGAESAITARLSAADGKVKWLKRDSSVLEPVAIAVDANQNVLLDGFRSVWKYAGSDGSTDWSIFDDSETWFYDLTLDGRGNVVATGRCHDANTGSDLCVMSVADATGLENWRLIDSTIGASDEGIGVVVAADGGILVSANFAVPGSSPLSLIRVSGPFADGIYSNGFEL